MPQDLFKWEDNGGLKHHCPICQTPLSHDKCRTVCLGNHVEWCHRYHCLFRKNWSSRCSACKTTDEQHEKRHREVAEILARIKKLKAEEEALAMELLGQPLTPKTPRTPLTIKALNSVSGPIPNPDMLDTLKTTKKERKALKKAVKAMERDKVVTTADIQFVASTLHASGKTEEEQLDDADMEEVNEEIRMNLKFNNSTCNTKSARHDFIKKDRTQLELDDGELARILSAFEVDTKATGKEGELVGELVEAIKNDLVHYHDELKMVARLRAGFWRWANKRNWRDLVDNGKQWDEKHEWYPEEQDPINGERRESEVSVETEPDPDTEGSRQGSIDSSVAESTGTSLTVPSSKASSSKKKKSVPSLELETPKKAAEDSGWTHVGKKVVKKAPVGKLTLSSNGGLHHLAGKPKSNFWALSNKDD